MAIFHNQNCLYKCTGNLKKKKIGKINQRENKELEIGELKFRGK